MSNRGRGRGSLFQRGRGGGLLGSAVRSVAGGIGLVSESVNAYKDKKSAEKGTASSEPGPSQQPQQSGAATSDETPPDQHLQPSPKDDLTERQWELDETQSELLSNPEGDDSTSSKRVQDIPELVSAFLKAHGSTTAATSGQPSSRLELPVILAQRRPKDRTRGFVRGYAPMLETVGINQAAWLDFLDKFDQSTTASPWIQVINFAEIGGFFVPIAPSIAISAAVYMTIEIGKDMHSRQRSNKFLSEMNEQYFYPKGLCCLLMTWREDTGKPQEIVDVTSTVASSMGSYDSGISNKFKKSHGKTYGDFALPESAPLIFPTLDVLAAADNEESVGFKQSLGNKKSYIQEYYDKRSQAQFAHNRPDNLLANQQEAPQFKSRYADPSHPSNNGSVISLITGGYINPNRLRQGANGPASKQEQGGRANKPGLPLPFKPVHATKKFLFNKDVLYLMVVNLPTEEELNEAKAALAQR
ncbi:hypothetical protein BKA59DRAFT_435141 [Fusarium tricinctum]|uniref:Uncharacterized protein n=1 Tax=Fusarium tricinctum TaxID=61284 RepID=A0A8K0RZJ1_9HYPO|nr:hypothetical protein BKA59DRAFT_435141 [Fusarium tricinctum]